MAQRSPEYAAWAHMVARCTRPTHHSFAAYGGRGIKVCGRWLGSFKFFLQDLGPRPPGRTASGKLSAYSLDRIDNDGNYEPGNCRWATWKEQANNKRPRPVRMPTKAMIEAARADRIKRRTQKLRALAIKARKNKKRFAARAQYERARLAILPLLFKNWPQVV